MRNQVVAMLIAVVVAVVLAVAANQWVDAHMGVQCVQTASNPPGNGLPVCHRVFQLGPLTVQQPDRPGDRPPNAD